MSKKFMCANLQEDRNGCFSLQRKVACDLWPPNIVMPKEPHDWRDAARAAALYENAEIEESDLIDAKGYVAFKFRTSIFLKTRFLLITSI